MRRIDSMLIDGSSVAYRCEASQDLNTWCKDVKGSRFSISTPFHTATRLLR